MSFFTKWERELSGKIEEGKMLAPRPTRSGNEKPYQQPVWNDLTWERMRNKNGFLFEITLPCEITSKYCKVI